MGRQSKAIQAEKEDMPTDQPVLSTCTHRVCQAPRLPGQIGSITAIGASHPIFLLTWRRNLKRNMVWGQVAKQYLCKYSKYLKSCLPNFFFFPNPTFGRSWHLLIRLHKGAGSWCPLSYMHFITYPLFVFSMLGTEIPMLAPEGRLSSNKLSISWIGCPEMLESNSAHFMVPSSRNL